jgi:uncharacterized membrane protein YbhN (UPF0104 family)
MPESIDTSSFHDGKRPCRYSYALVSVSLVTTFALFLLFGSLLDLDQSARTWGEMSLLFLLFCFSLVFFSNIARAGRLYSHFYPEMKGRFGLCLRIVLHHNFFNNLLPLRAGEVAFPLLLRRYFNIEFSRSAGALVSFRIADLTLLIVIGLIATAFGLHLSGNSDLLLCVLFSMAIAAILLTHLLRWAARTLPWAARHWELFKAGLPGTPAGVVRLSLWTLSIWSVKLLGYACILQAFIGMNLALSLLAALGGELASGIPLHTPAAIGSFEGGVLAVLLPTRISSETALTAAVNLHLFLLVVTMVSAGFGFFLGRGIHDTR